ncbi:hypothetical protein PHMEG_00033008 [Phytophthora megakarya]|uniref:RxLR effector protein n=1 Tax=Phytophthora megakarya TaxID=4795 RepID=A0A225UV94_9STRA|nr:hypothetical protein PHMEG_00033008 [Phytophthora megakarya]
MRVRIFVFAAWTIVAVSDTSDTNQGYLELVNRGDERVERFLRTSKITEKYNDVLSEEKFDDEERGILDIVKTTSVKSLDDLAADFSQVRGAFEYIDGENTYVLKLIAAMKKTPEDVSKYFHIPAKVKAMSSDQLQRDPGYLLWWAYSNFWNARKAQA